MIDLAVRSVETAPNAAKSGLRLIHEKYRFTPNLMGVMANVPAVLMSYLSLNELFEHTSFSPMEREIVLLATSVANNCEYCVAAHSVSAEMRRVPAEVIQAIRDGQPLSVYRWEALRALTEEVVVSRGWPDENAILQFFDAGYTRAQVLEVILGVALKTLSNYTNHVAETPLDAQFASAEWSAPAASPK